MPNDLSNAVHADVKAVEAFFVKELSKIESGVVTLLNDLKAVLTSTVDAAGPVVVAAAAAGFQAALASSTGGLSVLVKAAETAGLAVLEKQGVQLAETALQQFKTLVLGNVLKAVTSPTDNGGAKTTPTG